MTTQSPQERLEAIIDRSRSAFAVRCDCGEEGCPGIHRPSLSDPRVVSATLGSVIEAFLEQRENFDSSLFELASAYAKTAASTPVQPEGALAWSMTMAPSL